MFTYVSTRWTSKLACSALSRRAAGRQSAWSPTHFTSSRNSWGRKEITWWVQKPFLAHSLANYFSLTAPRHWPRDTKENQEGTAVVAEEREVVGGLLPPTANAFVAPPPDRPQAHDTQAEDVQSRKVSQEAQIKGLEEAEGTKREHKAKPWDYRSRQSGKFTSTCWGKS